METKLEHEEDLIILATGIGQIQDGLLFTQAAVGVAEGVLYLYNDNIPDSIQDDVAYYRVKRSIPVEDIKYMRHDKIKNNCELGCYRRLVLVFEDESKNCSLYYTKKEKKPAKLIYKYLKQHKVKSKKSKLDLSPLY